MQNLLLFFAKFGSVILFIVLEIFCFNLIVSQNDKQKNIYLHSANLVSGQINNRVNNVKNYLNLRKENDSLRVENARLLQQILNIPEAVINNESIEKDSNLIDYKIIPVTVCSKTVRLRNNHITLCQGSKNGLKSGMGVISANGVVGIIKEVSKNYAHVLSVLHSQCRISALIEDKNYFGNLIWRGSDIRKMYLEAIPKHVNISVGDEVVTSGYSIIFPKGIAIGKIDNFRIPSGSDNYEIEVALYNDLFSEINLYVIDKNKVEELIELEAQLIYE